MPEYPVRAAQPADLPAILDVTVAAFGERVRERMRTQLYEDSSHRLDQSRLVEVEGRVASYVRVSPRPLYYGSAILPMAGIGAVCAHPHDRGRGLPSAILRDSIAYMRAQGHVLSMLFTGIQAFYARLGWVPFGEQVCTIPLGEGTTSLPYEQGAGYTVRPFEAPDLGAVEAIYSAYNAPRCGMAVRDAAAWRDGHRRYLGVLPHLVAERAGRVVAYASARRREDILQVYEAGCLSGEEGAFPSLAAALLTGARNGGAGSIQLHLSESHGLAAALRSAVPAPTQTVISQHMMLRLLDLDGLLRAALPAFEERLAGQPGLAGLRATFDLQVGGQAAGLAVAAGRPALVPAGGGVRLALPESLFWRLFFGASTVSLLRDELAAGAAIRLTAHEEALLGALFPHQDMAYGAPDHF